jgi:hypothetical protein
MNRKILGTAVAAAMLMGGAAAAQTACEAGKSRDDITLSDARALYDCLSKAMYEGYVKGPKRWVPKDFVKDYRGWKAASTGPAAPGFHGERYLMTWVNPTGWDAYTEFKEEGAKMPAGTVIVKESFDVSEKGAAKPGPLFIMQKVEAGKSPETGDWYYMMVSPKGAPVPVPVMQACNACHQGNYAAQDGLGYPVEEVRVKR